MCGQQLGGFGSGCAGQSQRQPAGGWRQRAQTVAATVNGEQAGVRPVSWARSWPPPRLPLTLWPPPLLVGQRQSRRPAEQTPGSLCTHKQGAGGRYRVGRRGMAWWSGIGALRAEGRAECEGAPQASPWGIGATSSLPATGKVKVRELVQPLGLPRSSPAPGAPREGGGLCASSRQASPDHRAPGHRAAGAPVCVNGEGGAGRSVL